jgi:hypothetical protein
MEDGRKILGEVLPSCSWVQGRVIILSLWKKLKIQPLFEAWEKFKDCLGIGSVLIMHRIPINI